MRARPRGLSRHSGTGTAGSISTSGWVMKKTEGKGFVHTSVPESKGRWDGPTGQSREYKMVTHLLLLLIVVILGLEVKITIKK